MHRASLELVSDLSLDTVLERIVNLAREQVDAKYAALGVVDEQGVLVRFIQVGMSVEEVQRAGKPPVGPLYTAADVERTLWSLQPVPYDEPVGVAPGVHARFVEAGHMLGSASVQLSFQNGSPPRCVVFSGDVGPRNAPLLKDAVGFNHADAVVLRM